MELEVEDRNEPIILAYEEDSDKAIKMPEAKNKVIVKFGLSRKSQNGRVFVLDIGCGYAPVGDVNCDLFVEDVEGHRSNKEIKDHYLLDCKKIPNFVVCDAQYLPFKKNVFDIVVSRQVIEHIKQPMTMINEMVRTSKDLVVIETVHRRGEKLLRHRDWKHDRHINKFDFTYFGKASKKLNCIVLKSMAMSNIPMISIKGVQLLNMPYGIRVIMRKNDCLNKTLCPDKDWFVLEVQKSILS
jgi:SAM-dependent methyltransferase